jgi:hypothetical protein
VEIAYKPSQVDDFLRRGQRVSGALRRRRVPVPAVDDIHPFASNRAQFLRRVGDEGSTLYRLFEIIPAFTVLGLVEAGQLFLFAYPEANHHIHNFNEDKRKNPGV